MADVSYTPADVRPLPGAQVLAFPAASALTPGECVYLKSDGTVEQIDADAAATALVLGIVVSVPNGKLAAAIGDYVDVCVAGRVTGFAALTVGIILYASVTAGKISDARYAGSSGDFAFVVGLSVSADTIFVRPFTDTFAAL
jgi:hypothetical protein